jgi:predicted amidophosphoribosyltransferase
MGLRVREFSIILAVVAAAAVVIVLVRILRRRALNRLVRARFDSGLCVMCGADLRFGKEQCPRCGYKYDAVTAMVWDDTLQRRKSQERSDGGA